MSTPPPTPTPQSSQSHGYTTTTSEGAALTRLVSADRLGAYQAAAAGYGGDPLELYLWDHDLAAAALGDIAILEVALRNAMTEQLVRRANRPDWYAVDIDLDDRSLSSIKRAWGDIPASRRTPGRVVAQLMFGFWPDLLETGGKIYKDTPRQRQADYEQMWRDGMKDAFPGGRRLARARSEQFGRTWMFDVVKKVHALRNRVSHHEPLVNGMKMPGQQGRRLRVAEAHEACILLAKSLDRDLGAWFERNNQMAQIIPLRPPLTP